MVDPVCGMTVTPATAAGQTEYRGRVYGFCHPGCQQAFQGDPERYAHREVPTKTGG